jgi:hypothetical protein
MHYCSWFVATDPAIAVLINSIMRTVKCFFFILREYQHTFIVDPRTVLQGPSHHTFQNLRDMLKDTLYLVNTHMANTNIMD